MSATPLLKTPLHALHLELGAKMVAFAGYDMPVAYPAGIIAEHRHCRSAAALFDVSHMGQAELFGDGAARALETLVPMDVVDLPLHKQRYAFFTNSNGGILDDLMIARREGRSVPGRQRGLQGRRFPPPQHQHRRPLHRARCSTIRRCSRCKVRAPSARWPGSRPESAPFRS